MPAAALRDLTPRTEPSWAATTVAAACARSRSRAAKRLRRQLNKLNKSTQTLRGSFSAVWTATIAIKYSFCWIFDYFSRSTRFAILCTAQIAKFQKKTRHNFGGFDYSELFIQNFAFFKSKERFSTKFWWSSVGISRTCPKCQELSSSWKK